MIPDLFNYPGALVSAFLANLLAAVKANPARTVGYALALAVLAASALSGVTVPVLLGEVVAFIAAVERIRAVVAPMTNVLVHVSDIPADDEGLPPELLTDQG